MRSARDNKDSLYLDADNDGVADLIDVLFTSKYCVDELGTFPDQSVTHPELYTFTYMLGEAAKVVTIPAMASSACVNSEITLFYPDVAIS